MNATAPVTELNPSQRNLECFFAEYGAMDPAAFALAI
jgi:hypothetical protein